MWWNIVEHQIWKVHEFLRYQKMNEFHEKKKLFEEQKTFKHYKNILKEKKHNLDTSEKETSQS